MRVGLSLSVSLSLSLSPSLCLSPGIHVCIYIYIHIYIYISTYMYICIYICVYALTDAQRKRHLYLYIYTSLYTCMCIKAYMCIIRVMRFRFPESLCLKDWHRQREGEGRSHRVAIQPCCSDPTVAPSAASRASLLLWWANVEPFGWIVLCG